MGRCTRRKVTGGREWEKNFHCYFLTRLQYVLFNYTMRATRSAHLTIFYLISITVLGDQYKWHSSSHLRCRSSDTRTGQRLYTCIRNVFFAVLYASLGSVYVYKSVLCQVWVYVLCAPSLKKFISVYGMRCSRRWQRTSTCVTEYKPVRSDSPCPMCWENLPFRVEHSPSMRRCFSRKRWYLCTKPHGFTRRKTVVWVKFDVLSTWYRGSRWIKKGFSG